MVNKDRTVFDVGYLSDSENVGAYVRSGQSGALVTNRSMLSNPGLSFVFVDGDITAASDYITEAAHGLMTGDQVQFTTSGTLPSALALATDYWIIRRSSSTFQVATSPANAETGVAIDLAADGSGNHTVTSQEVNRRALDVYVSNPLEIDVGLNAADDSVTSWTFDGTGNAISSTGGALHVSDGGGSLTVDASDLDIRNLVFASDKVDVTGSTVGITGTVAVTQSSSWVVSALNLDIRDLTAASDSVASWTRDGAGNVINSTSNALNVYLTGSAALTVSDAALADTALLSTQKNVTNVSGALLASQQAARKYLFVQNLGPSPIYVGMSGVTTANGFRVSNGNSIELRLGAALSLHAVSNSASNTDTRILQAS